MAERELYPDGEQRRRIMDFIMAAGQTLLENGAEVFRVEQTMEIMAASFHLREFHVYVLTNGIFASAGTAEMSEVRNVPTRTTHLGRVAAVNQLSRQIASGEVDTIDEAETRLAQARCIPFPKDWVQLAAGMGGAFCFALIFGGDLKAGLAAAAAGVAANAYLLFCEDRQTFQCWPSYRKIGEAVGLSPNTICKHIRSLEERDLLVTEPTQVTTKDDRKRNGNLRFTIRPIQFALQQDYDRQMQKLDEDATRRKYADFIENTG